MCSKSFRTASRYLAVVALFALPLTGVANAAAVPDSIEARTQRIRNGAGLSVGSWRPEEPTGFRHEGIPSFQGWLEKGLDLHLAWLNTVGYWHRRTTWTTSSVLTGTTSNERQTHLVPTLTSLCLFPFTTPSSAIEPFVNAGVGPVFAVQKEKSTGAFGAAENTTAIQTGFGIRAGAGVDVHMNSAFGLTVGGHFESASFDEKLAGQRMFQGWGGDFGLTYKFQYH